MNVEYAGVMRRFSSHGWVSNWDDSKPNVWLTAWVIRTFSHVTYQDWEDYIYIDPMVVGSAVMWLINYQVWTLIQYFYVPFFVKKIIDLPGGQINDPWLGKHYSLMFLPATPSSPSRTLEGLFELTRPPSRALDSPRALLPELQRYKDTVRGVPGHCPKQLTLVRL